MLGYLSGPWHLERTLGKPSAESLSPALDQRHSGRPPADLWARSGLPHPQARLPEPVPAWPTLLEGPRQTAKAAEL